MQYLKEEIRREILIAATDEFYQKGFVKGSIRRIAENSNISTGNIYRYFEDKKDLFQQVVQPTYQKIDDLIFHLYETHSAHIKEIGTRLAHEIVQVYQKHQKPLYILIDKSQGSIYEDFTDQMKEKVSRRIVGWMNRSEKNVEEIFIHIVTSGFLDGLFILLHKFDDIQELEKNINILLVFYFDQMNERLE